MRTKIKKSKRALPKSISFHISTFVNEMDTEERLSLLRTIVDSFGYVGVQIGKEDEFNFEGKDCHLGDFANDVLVIKAG